MKLGADSAAVSPISHGRTRCLVLLYTPEYIYARKLIPSPKELPYLAIKIPKYV